MPYNRKKNFYPNLSSFSNKLFFDVGNTLIIIQRESETTIWKTDFEKKILQRVRFWNKINSTSDSEKKISQRVRFWTEKNTTRYILN